MNDEVIPESLRKRSPPEFMRAAATLFTDKNAEYGNNYQRFGKALLALFPDGKININTVEDADRFHIVCSILNKLIRYAENLNKGGHIDSADDLIVYSAMLREFTKVP